MLSRLELRNKRWWTVVETALKVNSGYRFGIKNKTETVIGSQFLLQMF